MLTLWLEDLIAEKMILQIMVNYDLNFTQHFPIALPQEHLKSSFTHIEVQFQSVSIAI